MKIADQSSIEVFHSESNLEGIKGLGRVSCSRGKHVEFDEIFIGGELVLFPGVEVSSGVSFSISGQKGSVHLFPERLPVSDPVYFFVDDGVERGLGEAVCFSCLHERQGDENPIEVCGERSFVCENVDLDLSFPRFVFGFGAVIVVGFVDDAFGWSSGDGSRRRKRNFGSLLGGPVFDIVL